MVIHIAHIGQESSLDDIKKALSYKNIAFDPSLIATLIINGETKKAVFLLDDERISFDLEHLIQLVCKHNQPEVLKKLLKIKGIDDIDKDVLYKATQWSIIRNDSQCLKIMLDNKRVNPSNDYNALLYLATVEGKEKCVYYLLNDERVNPNQISINKSSYPYNAPFIEAVIEGYGKCLKEFFKCERFDISFFRNEINYHYFKIGDVDENIYNLIMQHIRSKKLKKII